jgi:hypothetical protein
MWRFLLGLAVAAGVALVAAGVVPAGNPGREKIARTAAGNAQAKAEVLRRGDLGTGWSGGLRKPVLNSPEPCSYHPKQSDLVVVGAAKTTWGKPAYAIDSEAQVLRTAAMVRRDWRRTVVAPQVLPCLRQAFKKLLGSQGKVVSVRRVAFPHVAPYTRAWRFLARIENGSGGSVPFESDFVALGAGRSEVTLSLVASGDARASLHADALRLARVLAHRLHS